MRLIKGKDMQTFIQDFFIQFDNEITHFNAEEI